MPIAIQPLQATDLPAANQLIRQAFGSFRGVTDPTQLAQFWSDLDYATHRWYADPQAAFGAFLDDRLVGLVLATRWGSCGSFGPLVVHPDLWDQGVGQQLIQRAIDLFDQWGVTHAGLFTFSNSPKHLGLYQKFDFWPRALTVILSKSVHPVGSPLDITWTRYSQLPPAAQADAIAAAADLTDAIYPGLRIDREIRSIQQHHLGDTVLLWNGKDLLGLATCHCGANTEAGLGNCYVKFGAVRSEGTLETRSAEWLRDLLIACEGLAAQHHLENLTLGINTARHEAYRSLLAQGFRIARQGIAMHRANQAGYSRSGLYVLDDWR